MGNYNIPKSSSENNNKQSYIDKFLNFIETEILNERISEKVRLQNVNLYKTMCDIQNSISLKKELEKYYKIEATIGSNYIKSYIDKNRNEILNGNILLAPIFIGDYLKEVMFIKKKNKISTYGEKVRNLLGAILTPQQGHI